MQDLPPALAPLPPFPGRTAAGLDAVESPALAIGVWDVGASACCPSPLAFSAGTGLAVSLSVGVAAMLEEVLVVTMRFAPEADTIS